MKNYRLMIKTGSILGTKNCLTVAVHCRNQNVSRKTTPKSDLLKRVSYMIFNKNTLSSQTRLHAPLMDLEKEE